MASVVLAANKPSAVPEVDYQYGGSLAIVKGELLYMDTGAVAKPFAQLTPGANEAADQATVSAAFAGVAGESKTSSDAAGTVKVIPVCNDIDMPCVSDTFTIGTLVAATRDGGGALVSQKVKKTTDPTLALGYVSKYPGSGAVTTVRVRLFSTLTPQLAGMFS